MSRPSRVPVQMKQGVPLHHPSASPLPGPDYCQAQQQAPDRQDVAGQPALAANLAEISPSNYLDEACMPVHQNPADLSSAHCHDQQQPSKQSTVPPSSADWTSDHGGSSHTGPIPDAKFAAVPIKPPSAFYASALEGPARQCKPAIYQVKQQVLPAISIERPVACCVSALEGPVQQCKPDHQQVKQPELPAYPIGQPNAVAPALEHPAQQSKPDHQHVKHPELPAYSIERPVAGASALEAPALQCKPFNRQAQQPALPVLPTKTLCLLRFST